MDAQKHNKYNLHGFPLYFNCQRNYFIFFDDSKTPHRSVKENGALSISTENVIKIDCIIFVRFVTLFPTPAKVCFYIEIHCADYKTIIY